jgi:pimeloyl-ACP methyl ester carboxylesterase
LRSVSGYTNQASIQISIAVNLARLLRAGQYTSKIGIPKSLVLVGHSYGSLISNIFLAKFPTLADAAVLTGFAYAPQPSYTSVFLASQAARIASVQNPGKYAHLDTGYITFADLFAHVNTFFKAPSYEVKAAEYAHSISQPAALTEFLTASANPYSPDFGGPVLVTSGEFDMPFCGGECYSTFAEQKLGDVFPKSRLPVSFVHPGAGHGVNFGKNATGFYEGISNFLERAGF